MQLKKVIVSGISGFVGKALARKLKALGYEVVGISRRFCPDLESEGIKCISCDITSTNIQLINACAEADTFFHVAAKVDMWGKYKDFFRANVIGTRNMLELCRTSKINKFIFTSSPSVIANSKDLNSVDESIAYPRHYLAYYPLTKAIAEKEVLAANCTKLRTLALRPHLIWGPGDVNFVPTVLERARKGQLVRVGSGKNLVDLCFIDDCVNAHILAMHALDKNAESHGRAYFISQGEPVNLWDWIDRVLVLNGLEKIKKSVPKSMAWCLAYIFEIFAGASKEPRFTRFLVSEMTTNHYFNINLAKQHLGYRPTLSIEQAMRLTFPATFSENSSVADAMQHVG